MNDDIEGRLRRARPRGAPPELRARVLEAVAGRLRRETRRSFLGSLHPAIVIAASLLGGLGLNYWVNDTIDRRLAIAFGPPPISKQSAEIAAEIAAITDPATGRWAYRRLTAIQPGGEDARQYATRIRRMIEELTVDMKETTHEATRKNPQMGRDRSGSRDRHLSDIQCVLRLEQGHRA